MSHDPAFARVLQLQRMSTEDGPGIRTTVFFKGCSLACDWCHNPESIAPQAQLVWHGVRCMGCGGCLARCEHDALQQGGAGPQIHRERCTGCGACVEACPTGALELLGQRRSVDQLVAEVEKDRAFYEESGGGVTVSGGEPSTQPRVVERFLEACRARGLHTALDTCGQCAEAVLRRLVRHADLVLFDLKLMDPEAHRRHTGHDNHLLQANLLALWGRAAAEEAPPLWVRTPLIPGVTATEDNLRATARFLGERLGPALQRWELCAFNPLCRDKYERLDLPWPYASEPTMEASLLEHLLQVARSQALDPSLVHLTGATRRSS